MNWFAVAATVVGLLLITGMLLCALMVEADEDDPPRPDPARWVG